jgi:putative heme-binding domain-containing protein
MGNIHGNCINVDKLRRDGSTYFATGEPDFLTANDAWFMPVGQETGPDGCLYILDWYDRYHCYQDANRDPNGIDRLKGRLYRIRYKDSPRAAGFDLSKETDEQLIQRLAAENDFIRSTAQRLLTERRAERNWAVDDPILKKIEPLVLDKRAPRKARLHAAWVALSLQPPSDDFLNDLLRQPDTTLKAWAIRCAGDHRVGDSVAGGILVQSNDPLPDVQLQAVIAMGKKIDGVGLVTFLVDVASRCGNDKLIPHIIWQRLHPLLEEDAATFVYAVARARVISAPALAEIIPRAMERMLANRKFDPQPVAGLFGVARDRLPQVAKRCLELLAAKIQSGEIKGEHLAELKTAFTTPLTPLLGNPAAHPVGLDAALVAVSWKDLRGIDYVRQTFTTGGLDPALRLRALASLIAAGDEKLLPSVGNVLTETSSSREFPGQVLAALGRLDSPEVVGVVLAAYSKLPADAQPKAIELLTQRAVWARPLVEAMGAGKVPPTAMNVNQAQKLMSFNDKELTAAVAKHWGTIRTSRDPAREQFVAEMRKLVTGTPGDARRGTAVFNKVCGQCHKIYGQGQEVGPDITSNGRASLEQLLSNVFDPSLVIGAAYQARTVRTADARIVTGLLVEDNDQRVVLKLQGGKLETIARADVDATKVSELSLMPEGLEKQLQPQEIADLFAFISLDKHPDDPQARPIPNR